MSSHIIKNLSNSAVASKLFFVFCFVFCITVYDIVPLPMTEGNWCCSFLADKFTLGSK